MLLFLLLALVWFKKGKRVLSLFIFFGFLTGGYQLIPDVAFAFPVSIKPTDYAILYLLCVIAMEYFSGKRKELIALLPKFTIVFLSFIAVAAGVSIFIHHIPVVEVVKNTREYFLLLTPILYYTLTKDEIKRIIELLFKTTIFLSILYVLQPMLGIPILQGYYTEGETSLFGLFEIARFYNTPTYLYFFFFFVLYNSDFTKKQKLLYLTYALSPYYHPSTSSF